VLQLAREGVSNLVKNCAEVRSGEIVALVNDPAWINKEISGLIEAAVERQGAKTLVIWVEASGEGAGDPEGLTSEQRTNIRDANKIIAHADATALAAELDEAGRDALLVSNRNGKMEFFASAAARYH